MVALLDGGVERIHVDVEENARRERRIRHGRLRGHQTTGSLASVFSGMERRGRWTRGASVGGGVGMANAPFGAGARDSSAGGSTTGADAGGSACAGGSGAGAGGSAAGVAAARGKSGAGAGGGRRQRGAGEIERDPRRFVDGQRALDEMGADENLFRLAEQGVGHAHGAFGGAAGDELDGIRRQLAVEVAHDEMVLRADFDFDLGQVAERRVGAVAEQADGQRGRGGHGAAEPAGHGQRDAVARAARWRKRCRIGDSLLRSRYWPATRSIAVALGDVAQQSPSGGTGVARSLVGARAAGTQSARARTSVLRANDSK
jgi:hypothetical protein